MQPQRAQSALTQSPPNQPLRPWVPPPRSAKLIAPDRWDDETPAPAARPPAARPLGIVSDKDMAFCAEFAVHGGAATAPKGFRGEADLVRMQKSGLLDLVRDPVAPFNVIAVSLTAAARARLSAPSSIPTPGVFPQPPAPAPATQDQGSRRNGFEVARGMIGAAVKAEIAAWSASGAPGGAASLEARVMARITGLGAPFPN